MEEEIPARRSRTGLRRLLGPVWRVPASRYQALHRHSESADARSGAAFDAANATREHVVAVDQRLALVDEHVRALAGRQLDVEQNLRVDVEVFGELTRVVRRVIDRLDSRLDELDELTDGSVLDRLASADPYFVDRALRRLVGTPLSELGPGTAELLNWATETHGFAAQAGLHFTPAVLARHRVGDYGVVSVNERILEAPYVFGALSELPVGSRIFDFGACYSTLALALASTGYEVTALDLRPYPLQHPNLVAVAEPIEDWAGPDEPFDAIVSLSTLEHVGLGAYGDEPADDTADARAMERIRSWLRADGRLVLTAPYGRWRVENGFQRVYDAEHLEDLLAGWKVLERRYYVQHDALVWSRCEGIPDVSSWSDTTRGVVLLTATPT